MNIYNMQINPRVHLFRSAGLFSSILLRHLREDPLFIITFILFTPENIAKFMKIL
jgi:hypothetical protein